MKAPKIDSPCPLRWTALPTADRNFCTRCERKVHDLSGMTQLQRREFFASCSGKVCIAYTLPPARKSTLRVGLGVAAAIAAAPALAQDGAPQAMSPFQGVQVFPYAEPAVKCDDENGAVPSPLESIVIVGGVIDPQNVRWVEADAGHPQLPVVPEDAFLDAEFVEDPATPNQR